MMKRIDVALEPCWQIAKWMGVVLLGVGLLTGCEDDTDIRTRPQNLLDAPEEHVGETVVISGEVNRVFGPRTFTVGGTDFAQNLLVVSSDSIAAVQGRTGAVPLAEEDIVQVTGVVQRFNADEFQQQYDVSLPDDAASKFDGRPVVVAQQGTAAMHGVVVSPRLPGQASGTVNELAMATDTSQQSDLRGRVAAFPSAPIQEVVQDRIFWIGSSEDQRLLVVVNPDSTPELEKGDAQRPQSGQEWMLHGIFRELPPPGTLRAEWGLSDDVISELQNQEVYLQALKAQPATGEGA